MHHSSFELKQGLLTLFRTKPQRKYQSVVNNFLFCAYYEQLNALALVQGITSLNINPDGNPISIKGFERWRAYAIYRLEHWGLQVWPITIKFIDLPVGPKNVTSVTIENSEDIAPLGVAFSGSTTSCEKANIKFC